MVLHREPCCSYWYIWFAVGIICFFAGAGLRDLVPIIGTRAKSPSSRAIGDVHAARGRSEHRMPLLPVADRERAVDPRSDDQRVAEKRRASELIHAAANQALAAHLARANRTSDDTADAQGPHR